MGDGAAQRAIAEREPQRKSKFNLNRAQVVDENFVEFVRNWVDPRASRSTPARDDGAASPPLPYGRRTDRAPLVSSNPQSAFANRQLNDPIIPGTALTCRVGVELFESQIVARHQDIVAREMRARNEGFYTIGSAGHEGNAVGGRLTRHTDMAFLHYRSGAFLAERARKVPGIDFVKDTMLSFAASSDDPISGGRHKVWGSVELFVPPQTSTIASHLPKSVGAALMLARAHRLASKHDGNTARGEARGSLTIPADGIIVCSFGDATVNHAVAQTAFNVAAWAAHQRIPVPILFVCEDNGIGISVETPAGWIESVFGNRCGISYFRANGLELVEAYDVTAEAVETCRQRRCPVFLHLEMVRLLAHAGSDAETEYHTWEQIEAAEAQDPLLATARLLLSTGVMTPDDILGVYERVRARVKEAAAYAAKTPKLSSAKEIVTPLAPYTPSAVEAEARRPPPYEQRINVFGGEDQLPERGPAKHMAALINLGLHDLLIKYPESVLFGEDVAKKGGVYHVTTGVWAKFGPGRVFNTLLDETSILGLAIGAGHLGLLPIPEIQYLAYYHNAEDQIRGEACSLQFFSKAQYRNPMVIRIQGWGYQKGFGGHFHNDNSIAALRDVPGLVIATPARGHDAVNMMRTCMALAKVDGRVVAFIEPIALYMTKDLHAPKDQGWSFSYPPPDQAIAFGEGRVYRSEGRGEGTKAQRDEGNRQSAIEDVTILTFANGVYMSLRAAKSLREQHGIHARVVDLRWLNPLNEPFILEQSLATRRVLVVDEGRRTGGISEAILALLHEHCGAEVRATRLTALDTYIPLGPAADCVLPQEADIVRSAQTLLDARASDKPTLDRLPFTQSIKGEGAGPR